MKLFKTIFLYVVGAVAVAYEELEKNMKVRQEKIAKNGAKVHA